ncbi:hypothetical protein [Aeoliella sp. SH292]|uniref:hypothetical protein n=1 Tax=Aeoliella sp. SH292 TaxID=3454464 RepID=UPI003F9D8940
MLHPLRNLILFTALLLLSSGGCSDSPEGVETHPLTGVVTLNGKPESGVVLTFLAEGEGGTNASAVTDDAGEFVAATSFDMGTREQEGVIAGTYRVTATKFEKPDFSGKQTAPKNLLPAKYSRAQTSDLTTTVTAGQENRVTFELK